MSNNKNNIFSPELVSHLRVVDLRRELKALGMPVSGRKTVLQQRLRLARSAMRQSVPSPVPAASSPVTPSPSASAQSVLDSISKLVEFTTPVSEGSNSAPEWSPELSSSPRTPALSEEVANKKKRPSPKRALFTDHDEGDRRASEPRPALRKSGSEPKRQRISFGHTEVRRYALAHGGSLSTPSKGAFPLGLDWEYDENTDRKPVHEYEEEKQLTPKRLRRLNETQRKLLLERMDKRSYFEKQASWETEKEELKQIRRSRCNVGCGCTSPGACGTRRCLCVREGLACNDDSCRCSDVTCNNHLRYNFDQGRVDQYRRQKIMLAPYTERESQKSGWSAVGAWAFE